MKKNGKENVNAPDKDADNIEVRAEKNEEKEERRGGYYSKER